MPSARPLNGLGSFPVRTSTISIAPNCLLRWISEGYWQHYHRKHPRQRSKDRHSIMNVCLYTDILEQGGGILSEQPPGTAPLPKNFPARNRIISGLSDAVLVLEAGEKSGSLITVDMALEQGRDVYALPGPVNSTLSYGCNRLIRQGAGLLLSPDSLIEEWNLKKTRNFCGSKKEIKNEKTLESTEKLVYSCLGLYPKDLNQLVRETKLDIKDVLEKLISLELQGLICEISKNHYIISG